jgi:hypothetical protein
VRSTNLLQRSGLGTSCLKLPRMEDEMGRRKSIFNLYILNGKELVPCSNPTEWAHYLWTNNRHVGEDVVGNVTISTVFLGLDHNFMTDGPPLVFETMIFGGLHDKYQTRCSTWDEAEAQHAKAVALAKSGLQ